MHNRPKQIIIVFLLLFGGIASAQQRYNLNNFDGIKSEGAMPQDMRLSLDELYSLDKQRVRDYNDGKLRNRDRVLKASYQIYRTMLSGRILYGDPITRMVEDIADTLLKDYPTLRNELRFYTIKSPEVNAFATGQGMIFVCTGLVAQVEDEAQLAFIISHEIIHYLNKHSLETISRRKHDSDDIDAETQEMRDFIKYHNRSREMEREADSLGLTMFYLNSPYSKDVTEGVFDVLQYGYLPFDERPFDTTYFNTPYFRLPSDCFMKQVDPITARDDYNDSLSTHPNILKRRQATAAIIGQATGGQRFVTISQKDFEQIQALARFECVRQDLIYAEYTRAFYDCFLLQRLYPDNPWIERSLCQALYGLAKYKTYTNTSRVVGNYKDFEGEVQQCYYLFRHTKRDDLALVAARQLWLSHKHFPNDTVIAQMTDDLFADLAVKYDLKPDFFVANPPAADTSSVDEENLSKYERLKRKKNRQKADNPRAYVFTDLMMSDPAFTTYLNSHLQPLKQSNIVGRADGTPQALKHSNNQLVFSPTYTVVSKKTGELNITKSENNETNLYDLISSAAAKKGIASIDFSDQRLHDITSADQYNEWVELSEWVGEFWQTRGDFDMFFSVQPQMNRIVDKYDASTINMTFVANRENITERVGANALWYAWIMPLTPIAINQMVAHSEATLVYSIQIDAARAKKLSRHTALYDLKDENARIKSALYDHYANIDLDTLAAIPGYLGSRFNFALSPSIGPGTFGISIREGSFSFPRTMAVSLALGLDAEYIVSRKAALHLTAEFTPSSFFPGSKCFPYTTNAYGYQTLYSGSLIDSAQAINNLHFSIAWRSYKNLAPLGYYWDIALDLVHSKTVNPPDILIEKSKTMGGFHFQFGRNHILGEKLLFGYFARYGLLLGGDIFKSEAIGTLSFNPTITNLFRLGINIGLIPCRSARP
ncbi:MAG: M48 family metallopeptidase [Bacteroidales bacterium]|nr:M48 family metallopeptidase [Bacteroidales bacterium]